MKEENRLVFGGLSGVTLPVASFDLGEEIFLRQTYAHLMSPTMMAFSRPEKGKHHPPPWKAARGGYNFDIEVEVQIPASIRLGKSFNAQETIWLIAALLRLAKFPFLSVPVISDYSFQLIPNIEQEPFLCPFETEQRRVRPSKPESRILEMKPLSWLKERLVSTIDLIDGNPKFYAAFRAFDSSTIHGRTSSSLLMLWGGMEQLFAPSAGELRFRVASLISSYLEPPGPNRLALYKEILKLYDQRSLAAHTAEEVETIPLIKTYDVMREILIHIIDENRVPTQSDLEGLLFGCDVRCSSHDGHVGV